MLTAPALTPPRPRSRTRACRLQNRLLRELWPTFEMPSPVRCNKIALAFITPIFFLPTKAPHIKATHSKHLPHIPACTFSPSIKANLCRICRAGARNVWEQNLLKLNTETSGPSHQGVAFADTTGTKKNCHQQPRALIFPLFMLAGNWSTYLAKLACKHKLTPDLCGQSWFIPSDTFLTQNNHRAVNHDR